MHHRYVAQHHASIDALLQAQKQVCTAIGLDLGMPWLSFSMSTLERHVKV
jgi:hypothetical protein